ncbi:MAG TPA: tetratricopeptide repeat protein [Steroidobacteraceae bacterium]|nr:tetratricopeptide repeat protein [Steroidobacteraceae bacterium]
MRGAAWPLLGLWFMASASAAAPDAVAHIEAGRAALESEKPTVAASEFRAALGAAAADEDRLAALVGLGRAEQWLGHYRAALEAFQHARHFAVSTADQHLVDTGAARALNALDYHQEAYALVAPFAAGDPAASLELARAAIALGRTDEAVRFMGGPPADPSTRTGSDLLRAQSQIAYELAPRTEGGYSFLHDSDDLSVRTYELTARLPGTPGGASFNTWRAYAANSEISGFGQSDQLTEFAVGDRLRIGSREHLDVQAGAGSVSGRSFPEGSIEWEDQLTDTASLFASGDRVPVITPMALASGVLFSTLSLGASARVTDHWMVVPIYYHQLFSDGNQRDGARLKIVLTPLDMPGASALGAELDARIYRSTQPSTGVYFNPAQYRQAQLGLIGVHTFSPSWRIRITAGIGPETVDGSSALTWSAALSLTGRLPGNGRLELRVGRDSFASLAGGGSGYQSNGASLTVGWPFSSAEAGDSGSSAR